MVDYYNINYVLTIYKKKIIGFNVPCKAAFENIVGKGENAGSQHFLIFPQCFLLFQGQILPYQPSLICRLQILST